MTVWWQLRPFLLIIGCSQVLFRLFTRMGVSVRSGLMQLTAMPNGSHSCAIACTKFTMAAFVEE